MKLWYERPIGFQRNGRVELQIMLKIKIPWPAELVVSRNVTRNTSQYFACQHKDMDDDESLYDGDAVAVYKLDRLARVQKFTQLTPVPANGKSKARKASPAGKEK